MTTVREPVVAGAFYPGNKEALSRNLEELFGEGLRVNQEPLSSCAGLIVPHAGYIYSGPTAAVGYRHLAALGRPAWALILGANHTGLGRPISLAQDGNWRTPLGESPIASALADRLVQEGLEIAPEAFDREHAIEVQLPFLQFLYGPSVPFVPVCVMLPSFPELKAAGEAIARVVRNESPGAIIVSSDFTHYEPGEVARKKDRGAIERILALDTEGFHRKLVNESLSICGGGAITALLSAAGALGWRSAELLSYATSGDVTGDQSAVVGYAAIALGGNDAK